GIIAIGRRIATGRRGAPDLHSDDQILFRRTEARANPRGRGEGSNHQDPQFSPLALPLGLSIPTPLFLPPSSPRQLNKRRSRTGRPTAGPERSGTPRGVRPD